jgi:hypothetical protein
MGSLHQAIEFRGSGWQNKETDAPFLAGLLKSGLKLRATIYLDGSYRERHASEEGVQEALGCGSRSSGVYLQHIPTGDHIPGGKMLEYDSW